MTFGDTTTTRSNLVRVQEKEQVTLPVAVREELGIKRDDLVSVTVTPAGALITPQAIIAANDLEESRRILAEEGFSLDELIESGREIRGDLLREMYGIEPNVVQSTD
jgi:bifunctional DNA-binding transcriptional regulator/antitoxin component of YhaV-PrlF toxin-antitoxin module